MEQPNAQDKAGQRAHAMLLRPRTAERSRQDQFLRQHEMTPKCDDDADANSDSDSILDTYDL